MNSEYMKDGGIRMKEIITACLCGLAVGILFRLLKLPVPAPNALPGIMGIVGIYLGMKIIDWFLKAKFPLQ